MRAYEKQGTKDTMTALGEDNSKTDGSKTWTAPAVDTESSFSNFPQGWDVAPSVTALRESTLASPVRNEGRLRRRLAHLESRASTSLSKRDRHVRRLHPVVYVPATLFIGSGIVPSTIGPIWSSGV
ncbi:hypothetical protein KIN20_032003, partial [Parelaphostrongylus tenuis]